MSDFNIILEPRLMFDTLLELENQTNLTVIGLYSVALVLEDASKITYAVGFGDLIKQAEKDINHLGHIVMAANNAINVACSEVVNKLVEQFTSHGAKTDYSPVNYVDVQIKTNLADRVAIYVMSVGSLLEDMLRRILFFEEAFLKLDEIYANTKNFWVGSSADKTRLAFKTKVGPQFRELVNVLSQIHQKGLDWVEDAVKFESSLEVE